MNIYEKNYIRWYFQAHKKKFLCLEILLLICLPLFSLYSTEKISGSVYTVPFTVETIFYCVLMFILSLVVPIYNFHFLMDRRSVDTFFAMPIKRKRFFTLQFTLGIGCILVFVNGAYLLALLCNPSVWKYLKEYMLLLLLASFLITCLYTMYSFLLIKCNNFWDAIIICVGYSILPVFMFSGLNVLVGNALSSFLVSRIASVQEIYDIYSLSSFFSLPMVLFNMLGNFFENMFRIHASKEYLYDLFMTTQRLILLGFWGVISIFLYANARKNFARRSGEDSEQRTTSWLCYPVLIFFITASLLMNYDVNFQSFDAILSLLFVFVTYLIMVFFARRKIAVTKGILSMFVALCAVVMSITFTFTSTRGFDKIQEFPNIEDVKSVQFHCYIEGAQIQIDGKEIVNVYTEQVTDRNFIQEMYELQTLVVENLDNSKDNYEEGVFSINLTYTLQNEETIQREYLFKDEDLQREVVKSLEVLVNSGYLDKALQEYEFGKG